MVAETCSYSAGGKQSRAGKLPQVSLVKHRQATHWDGTTVAVLVLRTHGRQGLRAAATCGSLDKGKYLARLTASDRRMATYGASVGNLKTPSRTQATAAVIVSNQQAFS